MTRCRADDDQFEHSVELSPELLAAQREAHEDIEWFQATLIENREASADGSARTLVLSVADPVSITDGRRVRHVAQSLRWVDFYRQPGQFVALRYCATGPCLDTCDPESIRTAKHMLAIASSPYEARRESAMLDAAIIELLVSGSGNEDERRLASLEPGSLLDVSQCLGRGYCSLFSSHVGLASALEEARPLVLIAVGARGVAPVRAALSWTPVQAHATAHRVSLYYVAESPASAAFLLEWDAWRDAGVRVHPIYLTNGDGAAASAADAGAALETALFGGQHGLMGAVGGDPRDAAVLLSGLAGDAAAHVARRLTHAGIDTERLLFCEFF